MRVRSEPFDSRRTTRNDARRGWAPRVGRNRRCVLMNITLDRRDAVPVLTLVGRFDGYGATIFDQNVAPLANEATWVLDLSSVQYISSMGLRSLLRAEKRLREQHGGVVLVGSPPPIRQVLEMAGLLGHFRSAESIDAAVSLVRA